MTAVEDEWCDTCEQRTPWCQCPANGDAVTTESDSPEPPGRAGKVGNETTWWSGSISAEALDALSFPPVRYLIPGVLPEGGIVLLAGAPKSGKSMLALGAALAVAHGGKALGSLDVTTSGHVLTVSLDDQSRGRLQRRLRQVAQGEPLPAALTIHTEPTLGTGSAAAKNLDAYLTSHPETTLVVLDTLEHLRADRRPGESTYTGDVRFLANLRWISDRHPSTTFLCLTHTRKPKDGDSPDDPISAVSGSHGITGGADHVLILTGKRGVPRRVLDVITRDDDDSRKVLAFTAHGLEVTDDDPDDPTVYLTDADAKVYTALADYGSEGATAADLEPDLDGMPKIGNRLASLASKGYARRVQRGRYAVTR